VRLAGVAFQPSPNHSAGIVPRFLVLHYTAGRGFEQSCAWLANPRAKASAHFVVGRDGECAQLVGLDRKAWHAGRSKWGDLVGMNRHSFGIELDNPGKLKRTPKGWATWFGQAWPDDGVMVDGKGTGWAAYPDVQVMRAYELCERLIDLYPDIEDVIGHEDIAPGRKQDPGFAWPMDSFRTWLFGRESDEAPDLLA